LDPPVAARIIAGLTRFAETGYGDVRKLEGPGDEYRQRVGEWRVRFVYNVDEHAIIVLHILPRGRAYRD
jgi:mRNA interferase RelE/StbE